MNRRFFRRTLLVAVLLFVAAVCLQSVATACPTCKDSLAQHDPARAGLVRGYFWSILFMMSMPFLILGGLGSYFYLELRRAQARRAVPARPSIDDAPASTSPFAR